MGNNVERFGKQGMAHNQFSCYDQIDPPFMVIYSQEPNIYNLLGLNIMHASA